MITVFPSAEIATELPWYALPIAPEPTSFGPCCVHKPTSRVQIHAAPTPSLSGLAPTIAVLPSPEMATELACMPVPTPPAPTNFGPCCEKRFPVMLSKATLTFPCDVGDGLAKSIVNPVSADVVDDEPISTN